jgi:hypothetical protein
MSDIRERLAAALYESVVIPVNGDWSIDWKRVASAILAAMDERIGTAGFKAGVLEAVDDAVDSAVTGLASTVAALAQQVETIRQSQKADADLDHEMDERVAHLTARVEATEKNVNKLHEMIVWDCQHVERAAPSGDAAQDQPAEAGTPRCTLCGHPMPPGEEMFKYHGYSGPCPMTQDHGDGSTEATDESPGTPDGAASVQPSPASFPSEAFICDVRSGIVAVYRGPKRTCLAHAGDDPTVVFSRTGYKVEGPYDESLRVQFVHWEMHDEDVATAQAVCKALNDASPAIRAEAVTAFAAYLETHKATEFCIMSEQYRKVAARYLATLGGDHG